MQLTPTILDPPELRYLQDAHFYKAGHHLVLHHLDYVIMKKNYSDVLKYVSDQYDFWIWLEGWLKAFDTLYRDLVCELPDITNTGLSSQRIARCIRSLGQNLDNVGAEQQWNLQQSVEAPVYIPNRLVGRGSKTPSTIAYLH